MIPLWTQTNWLSSSERCGWELTALGSPCVAQRVCAIPTWTSNSPFQSTLSNAIQSFRRVKMKKIFFLLTFNCMFKFFDFSFLSYNQTRTFLIEKISIKSNTRRIITSIFQTMKTIDQNVSNESSITFDQVIQITEYTYSEKRKKNVRDKENLREDPVESITYHTLLFVRWRLAFFLSFVIQIFRWKKEKIIYTKKKKEKNCWCKNWRYERTRRGKNL